MGLSSFTATIRRKLIPFAYPCTGKPPPDDGLDDDPKQHLPSAPAPAPAPSKSGLRPPGRRARARAAAAKKGAPATTGRSTSARVAQRRARSKDGTAADIILALSSFTSIVPASYIDALADRLSTDDALLSDFLRPLVDPSAIVATASPSPTPPPSPSPPSTTAAAPGPPAAAAQPSPKTSSSTTTSSSMSSDVFTIKEAARPDLTTSNLLPPALDPDADARARLRTAWIVATFLRHGPPALRAALARPPAGHVTALLSVFKFTPDTVDPARAALVTDLLRALLHDHPREAAEALCQQRDAVPSLLRHATLPPVADLLPRLVALRPFPAGRIVPAHKRALVALSKAHAPAQLSRAALAAIGGLDHQKLATVVAALAEIGARAAEIPRKYEEPDERRDAAFTPSVGVITSAAFNDAADDLDLTIKPAPLLSVLDGALADASGDSALLLPVLHAVELVLRAVQVEKTAQTLAKALPKFVPALVDVLDHKDHSDANQTDDDNSNHKENDNNGNSDNKENNDANGNQKENSSSDRNKAPVRVGVLRVGTLDVITAAAECLPRAELAATFSEQRCALLRAVLALATRAPHNDVVAAAVGRILTGVFARGDAALVASAAAHAGAVHAAHARLAERPLADCVVAAARWADEDDDDDDDKSDDEDGMNEADEHKYDDNDNKDNKRKSKSHDSFDDKFKDELARLKALDVGSATRAQLREMAAAVQAEAEEEASDSFGSAARAGLQKSGSANLGDPNNRYSSASEDFGQELYVIGAVHEASRGRSETPPSDGVVDSVSNLFSSHGHKHHGVGGGGEGGGGGGGGRKHRFLRRRQ